MGAGADADLTKRDVVSHKPVGFGLYSGCRSG
jgi:hypothetical protein